MEIKCDNCDGTGWVCERHPESLWLDGDGCCGDAGMPCPCGIVEDLNEGEK